MVGKQHITESPLSPSIRSVLPNGVGVGLKQQFVEPLKANPASVDFIEVHAENFLKANAKQEMLVELSSLWPVSMHGVALSLGGDDPLDRDHLKGLKGVIDKVNAASFSEHIAWSRYQSVYFNDLLPVPYNQLMLKRLVERVDQVQQFLGRQMLLENPASYVRFCSDDIFEADFIAELVHRTGCGILLDINNLYISSRNHGWSAKDWLSRIQLNAVGELHLAGHEVSMDDDGDDLLVDTHGANVQEDVWLLYSDFLAMAGPRPTLIERDNNIPPFATIWQEVEAARLLSRTARELEHV